MAGLCSLSGDSEGIYMTKKELDKQRDAAYFKAVETLEADGNLTTRCCMNCEGRGYIRQNRGYIYITLLCRKCEGTGFLLEAMKPRGTDDLF